jgi:hypothetical protein
LEIAFFFPEFNIQNWYKENEIHFLQNKIKFNKNLLEHVALDKV